MLRPESRRLLTDALRPPTGHHLDLAVATTYSLGLVSLLMAPLAMAAHDAASATDDENADPMALLESVRRYASRTTVFCQAGAVHIPSRYRPVFGFIEESIVQVVPSREERVFHPKIWVLRFKDGAGEARHRFLCLSRNLTMDRCWDTVLQMEEAVTGEGADPAPIADFLLDVRELAPPLDYERHHQVEDLASTLRSVRLEVPSPFRTADFWPLGTPSAKGWPLTPEADRLVVISPFLDAGFLRRLPKPKASSRLVSRDQTFDRLGSRAIPPGYSTWVLQRAAETDDQDDAGAKDEGLRAHLELTSGLHAKTFVWDQGRTSHVLTGSANGTGAAFDGNVEFSVLLSGPSASCGTSAVIGDDGSAQADLGLGRLLQPHEIVSADPVPDPVFEAERVLEEFHARLAMGGVTVTASGKPEDDQGFTVQVFLPDVTPPDGTLSSVRILGREGHAQQLSHELVWRGVPPENLSPFVVVESTLTTDGPAVRRACVIKGTLVGGPPDRHRRILSNLIKNEKDLLRYLALLLGDPAFDSIIATLGEDLTGQSVGTMGHGAVDRDDLVVFEPLLRAAARRDGSLERVDSLLTELADSDGNVPHLSPAFLELWSTVWSATKELTR